MKREEGFTLIEVLVAAVVLIVGVLGVFTAVSASQKLTLLSERHTELAQRAQLELDRVKSLPYSQVALTQMSTAWSATPSDDTYVSTPAGACPASTGGSAPTYQPDHSSGGSTATEALVIDGCAYTIDGSSTTITTGAVVPMSSWNDGRMSGEIFDFVTWTSDPTCSQTTTPGSVCATTNDYKRITIVAVLTGVTGVNPPVVVSSLMADPNTSSSQNLLKSPSTSCTSGTQTVSCSDTLSGTPQQYFPCDTSYSSSSCGTPSCSGNLLHDTLVTALGILAAPDLLQQSVPSGSCTSGTTPTAPCYATDLLSGCHGLPIVPTGSTSCGSSPPTNNNESHSWVTAGIPSGTTVKLTGAGSLTTYIMSNSGVAVNVKLCLGLYLVPGGILGSLTGNLLSSPIGAAVSASVTAQAGVPTPVSFNFNTGLASVDQINGGGLLGLPRVEVVVWVAASASTSVSLVYDQTNFASQITLMTQ
jgi:Tfp pilus assembly protein PilV